MIYETCVARRTRRVRFKLKKLNKSGLPRLCVIRTSQHIHCQVINDKDSHTIASASTLSKKEFTSASSRNRAAAEIIGNILGEKIKNLGITALVLDRGKHRYHQGGVIDKLVSSVRAHGISI